MAEKQKTLDFNNHGNIEELQNTVFGNSQYKLPETYHYHAASTSSNDMFKSPASAGVYQVYLYYMQPG